MLIVDIDLDPFNTKNKYFLFDTIYLKKSNEVKLNHFLYLIISICLELLKINLLF